MRIMSTNFTWRHEYDVKWGRHKQRTTNTNDHHLPLNETPPWKFSAYATAAAYIFIAERMRPYDRKLCPCSKCDTYCAVCGHTITVFNFRKILLYSVNITYNGTWDKGPVHFSIPWDKSRDIPMGVPLDNSPAPFQHEAGQDPEVVFQFFGISWLVLRLPASEARAQSSVPLSHVLFSKYFQKSPWAISSAEN